MYTYSMKKTSCGLAKKCKRLCKNKDRINDIKVYRKFSKRKTNTIVKPIFYYLQQKDDVKMVIKKLKCNWISRMKNI